MSVDWLSLTGVAAGLVALGGSAWFYYLKILNKYSQGPTLTKRTTFLTPNEQHFFKLLAASCKNTYVVCPQVSMGALVDLTMTDKHPEYWANKQKFAMKICDFVLCVKETMEPAIVVELDDRTHNFERDALRANFLAKSGYTTLRFWSKNKPSLDELREILRKNSGTIPFKD